jgi:hypothetical protein
MAGVLRFQSATGVIGVAIHKCPSPHPKSIDAWIATLGIDTAEWV